MDFRLPELGEGITEATVVNLPLKAGDTVTKGQNLVDVETDKASMSLVAESAGTISEVLVKQGAKVKVGAILLKLSPAEESPNKPAPPAPAAKPATPADPKPALPATSERYEFLLPNLGEGIDSGMIVSIAAKPGEMLNEGQEAMTIETDKASMPVTCPVSGKVDEIKVQVGQKIRVGTVVATLTLQGSAKPSAAPAAKSPTTGPANDIAKPVASPAQAPAVSKHDPSLPVPAGPATRHYAREHGVALRDVPGTARGGRITVADVKTYIRNRLSQPANTASANGTVSAPVLPDFSKFGPIERKSFSTRRQAIAKNLTVSWHTAPAVTQFDLADITDLEAGRKRISETLPKGAAKVTMTVLAIKAVVAALKEFPNFNSSLDLGAGELVLKQFYHIGIAVDTPQGLVVPVIRDADKKSIRDLAKDIAELAEKARANKLTIDEMRGGSFTITNLGGIGGTAFSPIINYPEVAILGLARSSMQPFYRNGAFEPRLMMPLCLTYDHRVVDGADGARFTVRLVQLFSDPIRLLMES